MVPVLPEGLGIAPGAPHRPTRCRATAAPTKKPRAAKGRAGLKGQIQQVGGLGSETAQARPQWCVPSKNCSSSVEPFRAAVEAWASMVVVTASK